MKQYLGIDIGGTAVKLGIVDETGAARAMGEFGAVSVLSGHLRGETVTLPLQVEILFGDNKYVPAFAVSSILVVLAVLLLILRSVIEYIGRRKGRI